MRWKTTLTLLILTVALGAYVSLYELRQPTRDEQQALAKQVIPVQTDEVQGLIVDVPEANVTLRRQGDAWSLISPVKAPADESRIRSVLDALGALEADRVLEGSPRQSLKFAEFGLEPAVGSVTVLGSSKSAIVLFGDPTPVAGHRYAKTADSPKVFVISSELFDELNQPPEVYRSRDLLAFDTWTTEEIAVRAPGQSYTLKKQGTDHWQLTHPLRDEADRAEVSTLLSKLRGLKIERFLSEEPTPEQMAQWGLAAPETTISLTFANNPKPLEVLVGTPAGDAPDQRYAKRADEPAVYAVKSESLDGLPKDPGLFRARMLFDLAVSQAEKVHLSGPTEWTIERTASGWKGADGQALDPEPVEEWLWKLRDIKLVRFVEDQPKDLTRYGLEPPRGALQVWVAGQPDPAIQLFLGDFVGQGKTRYGRLAGRDAVVELPEILPDLLPATVSAFASEASASGGAGRQDQDKTAPSR